jgi:hypothetical protein
MKRASPETKVEIEYIEIDDDDDNEITTKKPRKEKEEEEALCEEKRSRIKKEEKWEKEEAQSAALRSGEVQSAEKKESESAVKKEAQGAEKEIKNTKAKSKNICHQKKEHKGQKKHKKEREEEKYLKRSLNNHTKKKSKNGTDEKENQNREQQKEKIMKGEMEKNTNQVENNKKRKIEDLRTSSDQEKNKKERLEEEEERVETEEEKNSREFCAKLRKLNTGEAWQIIPEKYKLLLIDHLEGVINNKKSWILELPKELLFKITTEIVEAYINLRITCKYFFKLLPDYYILYINNGNTTKQLFGDHSSLRKNNVEYIFPYNTMIYFVYRLINRIKEKTGIKYIINQKRSFEKNATHFLIEFSLNAEESRSTALPAKKLPSKTKKTYKKFRVQKKTGLIVNANAAHRPRGFIDMEYPENLFGKESGCLISTGDLIRNGICTNEYLLNIENIYYNNQSSQSREILKRPSQKNS